ncbi:MAG: 4Fe-4S dicluster domain-containing protein [Spirochaetes bacterium]|nr:4Fe-4S dicluster domain-containing protein [Spirochaetota bacterium]
MPKKGKVTFDIDLCKGCELCIGVCPVKIILLDKNKLNKSGYHPAAINDMDKCIACGSCAIMCPDSVITVEELD